METKFYRGVNYLMECPKCNTFVYILENRCWKCKTKKWEVVRKLVFFPK